MATTLRDWFHGLAGDPSSTTAAGLRSLAILVTWSIWEERNARVFNNTEKTVDRLVEEIKDEARLWCQAGAKHLAALVVNPSIE
jgi:formate dehydrogenase assembly factor FdhD